MTTPSERMRSLRFAREFLLEISSDDLVSAEMRGVAIEILASFPSVLSIKSLIDANNRGLPSEISDAIAMCYEFLMLAKSEPALGEVRLRELQFVLRHFPTRSEINFIAGSNGPNISRWFAEESMC